MKPHPILIVTSARATLYVQEHQNALKSKVIHHKIRSKIKNQQHHYRSNFKIQNAFAIRLHKCSLLFTEKSTRILEDYS